MLVFSEFTFAIKNLHLNQSLQDLIMISLTGLTLLSWNWSFKDLNMIAAFNFLFSIQFHLQNN